MESTQCPKPHFVVIPWSGTSYIIPIVDVACLLAEHGAPVTVITTPTRAQLVHGRVDRAGQGSSAGVTVAMIPFPAAEAGLPDGCERLDHIPSADLVPRFFDAAALFGEAVARHCRHLVPPRRLSAVVAGICNTWALGVAWRVSSVRLRESFPNATPYIGCNMPDLVIISVKTTKKFRKTSLLELA
ncbi:unnamed protein product [Urochloa humidicola]